MSNDNDELADECLHHDVSSRNVTKWDGHEPRLSAFNVDYDGFSKRHVEISSTSLNTTGFRHS